ncbi:RHS repeat domain-containing protein [Kitasatospora sp. A2-31]|uniref:RHS repeat domain-containing protein n=1 Tax=Kitasatospora sp. A2-31 TaxID=2916414 RepID=UPI00272E9BF4|nr:RHS repeat-associated core domain-containing protein [Kitasatospora sp. A2-31]
MLGVLVSPVAPALAAPLAGKDKDKVWSPPNTPLPKTPSVAGSPEKPKSVAAKKGSPDWVPPKTVPKVAAGSAVALLDAAPAAGANSLRKGADGVEVREAAAGASKQAGELPVWLAPVAPDGGAKGAAPAADSVPAGPPVKVTVADAKAAAAAGVQGALVSLARTEQADAAKVRVGLDLSGVGFGGGFAERARLVSLPACSLTTPEVVGCLERTPVPSHYDVQAKRLVADVDLPAVEVALTKGQQADAKSAGLAPSDAFSASASAPMVLAAEGTPSSGLGTYSATSLSPSQAWTAGSSSGSFTYSYPIQSPPTLGGAAPQVALGYDSASVDGRTSSTNAQASWIGDGWDLNAGFVERSYQVCDKAGIAGSGDQCWGGANLTLSLGGHSGELVPDDTSCVSGNARDEQSKCTWRLKNDDGTKVEFLTGATNGTWNGSYLKVTDTAGTVYYFGLNHLPSAAGAPTTVGPESKSAWTVPVYAPNAGDPCYDASKGKGSWCQTAWRWNLDYVVDVHSNLTAYAYAPETNWYARGGGQNRGSGTNTEYTRGGTLASIAYGQLLSDQLGANGAYQAASRIDFGIGERCVAGEAACAPAQRTAANAANWPDVPLDKQCAQQGTCSNYGPSYWSTQWLNSVTTSIRSNGAYRPVDRYELTHVFKSPSNSGENTQIPWLQTVKRFGKDTFNGQAEQELPAVTFADLLLPNRVDGLVPARPRYNRPRMELITTETGGTIGVEYVKDSCQRTTGKMPASPDSNTMACYNVKWYDTGVAAMVDDWFLRYPVASVTVDPNSNLIAGAVTKTTSYEYGDAAWHRNDGALVDDKSRTWDQFRGFAKVTAVTGSGQDGKKSKTSTSYYQGMDGDLKADGSKRSVTVAGPTSGAKTDSDWLSGRVLESDVYADADATAPQSWTVNTSSGPADTATHKRTGLPDLVARYAATTSTSVSTAKTSTGTRTTSTVTTTDKDRNNRVKTTLSTADGTPDVCTRNSYATGANGQMTGLVSEVLTISGSNACAAGPTSDNTVAGSRVLYDGQAFGNAGAKGEATGAQVLDRYDGATAQWVTTGTTAFDTYGRTVSVTDVASTDSANPNGATVTTSYSAANAGELPNQTVAGTPAPAGAPDAGAKRATTVTLNPARGLPLTTTDPNARTVTQSYDGLGRLKAVWTPGRATSESANYTFDYSVDGTERPSAITSRTLRSGGKDAVSSQIMDGLGRVVQTQTDPAISAYHGRLVTDTFYDSQGRTNRTYGTYYDDTSGPNTVRFNATPAQVPGQTYTEFDGMGRPVSSQFIALGVLQNTTTTAYPGADRVDVTPPAGATATSTVTDARGRTAQVWQYRTPGATGRQTDADVTTYTYTAGGQAATRTDAAGNTWSYGYDQRGRQVRADDPDTGVSIRTYDGAGRLATTTDARNQTVAITYDLLGRKTATYNGTVAPANQLTGYTYDTVAKGQAASSTRYVGGATGATYTKAVTAMDDAYRPTKTTVSIPGSEIGQSGQSTFEYEAVYDPITGAVTNEYRAAAGNLADESINYKYEAYGLLHDIGGAGDVYLRQSDWDAYGRNIRSTVNPFGWQIVATNTYDESTGRLLTQYIDKQTATNGTVQNTTYAYNQAGQITAIRTIPNNTPAATDLQCFTYDYLGRLTTAWSDTGQLDQPTPSLAGQGACANTTPTSGAVAPAKTTVGGSAAYWQDYTYDLTGNRTKLINHDPAGDVAKDLKTEQTFPAPGTRNTPTTAAGTGGGTGGPHALIKAKNTFGWSPGIQGSDQYDAAGNTTKITNPGGNKELKAGFVLKSGESVRSNGAQLTMQSDGNLVLTSLRSGQAVWATNTQDHPGAWATMQDDGNFVVYDPQRVALWSSKTYVGTGSGYFAVLQDDGKFIVYAPGWQSKWSTPTWNAVDAANGATLTWDVEGRLASLSQGGATTSYVYDADGNQLIRRNPGKVTVNLGGGDELTYDTNSKTSTGTRYYTIPGGITLVRQGPDKLSYQFSDHHGTNSLSIDRDSLTESRRTTDPFGVSRGPGSLTTPWSGDKGFVNGLKDDATGFTNLGARQYQPTTGRFLSPDPIMTPEDPQQWNAYGYSNSNPVNKADPSGLALEECASGMYRCSNNGTKIEGDGPNHDKIVAQVQAEAPLRQVAFQRFLRAQSPFSTYCPECHNTSGKGGVPPLPGAKGVRTPGADKWGIDKGSGPANNNMSALELTGGWFLNGLGRTQTFGGNSQLVTDLAKHDVIGQDRATLMARVQTGAPDAMDPIKVRYKDAGPEPGTLLNSPRGELNDLLGIITNGRLGTSNPSAAFLGSYSGFAWVKEIDARANLAKLHFEIDNTSGWNSATHKIPESWQDWIVAPLPGQSVDELLAWDEYWPIDRCVNSLAYIR